MSRLIDADALYERACRLEAQALDYVGKLIERDGDKFSVEWKIWSTVLTERTAFKHDVFDAPTAVADYIHNVDRVYSTGLLSATDCMDAARSVLDDLPSAQLEIIRCKDCKHYKIDHPKANGYHCCYRCHNIFPMKEDDFCSRAERRT